MHATSTLQAAPQVVGAPFTCSQKIDYQECTRLKSRSGKCLIYAQVSLLCRALYPKCFYYVVLCVQYSGRGALGVQEAGQVNELFFEEVQDGDLPLFRG